MTVSTYLPWALHQPISGTSPPSFADQLDVCAFVALAQDCGLMVVLRLGPYIDAEYDLGALPAWLLGNESGVRALRTN